MSPEYKKILQSLQMKQYAQVYFIDGEESFYLDELTKYFETSILPPAERDFNLVVMYGKDADWSDVVNACRRFPMFAEKQVVILKDAGSLRGGSEDLKGLNSLISYIQKPSPTTIFLMEHGGKKVDGKTRFGKLIKEKAVYFTSEKVKDDNIPNWVQAQGREMNFHVGDREAQLLATYLGNDLQKIINEIEKVRINVPDEKELTTQLIQKYIGISKEYNVLEFSDAITGNDRDKMFRMLTYFIANPKAAPMPLVVGLLYTQFSRIYMANFVRGKTDKEAAAAMGINPWFLKDITSKLNHWPLHRIERAILILGQYSTMCVGIKSYTNDNGELLKEMVGQLLE